MTVKLKYLGGGKDGHEEEIDSTITSLPTVIDGDSLHYFGDDAYAICKIDHDNQVVIYESMSLIGAQCDTMDGDDSVSPDGDGG